MIGDFPHFPVIFVTYLHRKGFPVIFVTFTRLTYIGRGIFNKTLQQNNPKTHVTRPHREDLGRYAPGMAVVASNFSALQFVSGAVPRRSPKHRG